MEYQLSSRRLIKKRFHQAAAKKIGENVMKKLYFSGMSQSDLARKTRMSDSRISTIIKGAGVVNAVDLILIARVLGTTCEELAGGAEFLESLYH